MYSCTRRLLRGGVLSEGVRGGRRGLYAGGGNSGAVQKPRKKMTTSRLHARYKKNMKLTMVTGYDYPSSQICDESEMDMILVGDSVGMVVMGQEDTVGVTMDQMVHHCQAVKRGSNYAFLVGDLPFGSYHTVESALHNATRLIKEGGMDAVKLEGGTRMVPQIQALTNCGISVIGHIGLTPQSYRSLGGYSVQGKKAHQAQALMQDAHDLVEAGVTAIVLEMLPSSLSKEITNAINVPTIGIGAGPATSGQVLVYHDMLGLFDKFQPKFSKQYASLRGDMVSALKTYRSEVIGGEFPLAKHSFEGPAAKGEAENMTTTSCDRRIAVIGGGAMGSLFAGQLSSVKSNEVTVVSQWKEHVAAINEKGLNILDYGCEVKKNRKFMENISATSTPNIDCSLEDNFDIVYILVKSRDTQVAAKTALRLVKPSGAVVTIQNGIGHEDIVKNVFENENKCVHLCFGITSYGAKVVGAGAVQSTGLGKTTIYCSKSDSSTEERESISVCASELRNAGFIVNTQGNTEMAQKQIWQKLAINAVINPLAALFNVHNGELLSHAPYARLLDAMVHEVSNISGPKTSWTTEELQTQVVNVLRLTRNNVNSMSSDIKNDVRTEFNNINGEILRLAKRHNEEAPLNSALATIFNAVEKEKFSNDEENASNTPIKVFKTINEMRDFRSKISRNEKIGFVPTMGALHSGHIALIEEASRKCDKIVVSLFVNPTQFSEQEDFDKYPCTLESDLAQLTNLNIVDAVFVPSASEMYPNFAASSKSQRRNNGQTVFVVPDKIENDTAEGKSRPNFFTGVSTVCMKLFNIIQPQIAFFGQKDATQVITIRQMVSELNVPVRIDVVSTLREEDGVAMSSRNVYLSAEDRAKAPILYRALSKAEKDYREKGERSVRALKQDVILELQADPNISIDYISVADGTSSTELEDDDLCASPTLISIAAKIGNTRLIDNVVLGQ